MCREFFIFLLIQFMKNLNLPLLQNFKTTNINFYWLMHHKILQILSNYRDLFILEQRLSWILFRRRTL